MLINLVITVYVYQIICCHHKYMQFLFKNVFKNVLYTDLGAN